MPLAFMQLGAWSLLHKNDAAGELQNASALRFGWGRGSATPFSPLEF